MTCVSLPSTAARIISPTARATQMQSVGVNARGIPTADNPRLAAPRTLLYCPSRPEGAPPMPKHWRCAVVGTGLAGEWHVRDVPQLPNASLVAISEQNSARARSVLDKYKLANVPVYADLPEMLARHPDID